jgi:hypothetical protein
MAVEKSTGSDLGAGVVVVLAVAEDAGPMPFAESGDPHRPFQFRD